MREKLANYAQEIIKNKNILKIYSELAEIFKNEGLYLSQAGCIEKIWHITLEPELLKKEGDIFLNSLNDPGTASEVYKLYFQAINPNFYTDFMTALNRFGYESLTPEFTKTEEASELTKLADKYTIIIYMMMLLHKYNDQEGILIFSKYLDKINKMAFDIIKSEKNVIKEDYDDTIGSNEYFSYLIGTTITDIELNKLAIKLNPKNDKAYWNIIEQYLAQKDNKKALKFYNKEYAPAFDSNLVNSVVDICWKLSDNCYRSEDYFNAIRYQQMAIDSELEKEKV